MGEIVFALPLEFSRTIPQTVPVWNISKRESVGNTVRICAVGDIGFSGQIAMEIEKSGYERRFAKITPFLRRADVVFGNLETPLLSSLEKSAQFAANMGAAGALRHTGFSILNLANNHIYDYGASGLRSTMKACAAAGIQILGAGENILSASRLVRTDKDGVKVGWLGCGRTLKVQSETGPNYWEFDQEKILNAIKSNRSKVDMLILSIHIGLMYLDYPDPKHKLFAEKALNQGADIILMHHAHVLQGIKHQDGKVICFNLGNFLLDWKEGYVQGKSALREQTEGAIFAFEIDKQGVSRFDVIPTFLSQDFCVQWAEGERGIGILGRLQRISSDLEGDYSRQFLSQRAERNVSHSMQVLWFHLKKGNFNILKEYIGLFRWRHLLLLFRWLWSGILSR